MSDVLQHNRLETEAIVIGYAMSRLDSTYLNDLGFKNWTEAYQSANAALNEPTATFKNLRDEFDPLHSNSRLGWWKRPLRQSRQRVLDELSAVSDAALIELVKRILRRDDEATKEAIDSLAVVTNRASNVAERLLTGRLAEEFFLQNSFEIADIEPTDILDCRNAACGFDFSTRAQPALAVEVKGIKDQSGSILFTDLEWSIAKQKNADYILVVVGNLKSSPQSIVVPDPFSALDASCIFQHSVIAAWRSWVSLV